MKTICIAAMYKMLITKSYRRFRSMSGLAQAGVYDHRNIYANLQVHRPLELL